MASITWREERDEWEVRWSEWSVETDPTTGAQTKRRVRLPVRPALGTYTDFRRGPVGVL